VGRGIISVRRPIHKVSLRVDPLFWAATGFTHL
jgi:hypothetical protein